MRAAILSLLFCFALSLSACGTQPVLPEPVEQQGEKTKEEGNQSMSIRVTIGRKTFTADIENSETGKAFVSKLPLTLNMSELGGNEKYCYGVSLPHADRYYDVITSGDLMLYSGNCIVLFYGAAGGYSYSRIGKLTGTDGLEEALGSGSVTVTFEKA